MGTISSKASERFFEEKEYAKFQLEDLDSLGEEFKEQLLRKFPRKGMSNPHTAQNVFDAQRLHGYILTE